MERIAQGLKNLEVELNLILTSPYLRAADTARILRKVFEMGKGDVLETDHLEPTGYADQLVNLINEKYASVANLALVGHEPYLGNLISVLVSGDPDSSFTLKKGGVCRLAVDTLQYRRCATLHWLLAPSQLAELAD